MNTFFLIGRQNVSKNAKKLFWVPQKIQRKYIFCKLQQYGFVVVYDLVCSEVIKMVKITKNKILPHIF